MLGVLLRGSVMRSGAWSRHPQSRRAAVQSGAADSAIVDRPDRRAWRPVRPPACRPVGDCQKARSPICRPARNARGGFQAARQNDAQVRAVRTETILAPSRRLKCHRNSSQTRTGSQRLNKQASETAEMGESPACAQQHEQCDRVNATTSLSSVASAEEWKRGL